MKLNPHYVVSLYGRTNADAAVSYVCQPVSFPGRHRVITVHKIGLPACRDIPKDTVFRCR